MNEKTKPEKSNLSNSSTYAKVENLYTNIKEMYEHGSKQTFMTLNLQFIISQMMALSEKATTGFVEENPKLKHLLTHHAESFYQDYQGRGFYFIENSIGFIYCVMTLLFKNMIFSKASYDILQYLGSLDQSKLFLSKEMVLRNLLNNENKLERMDFLFLTEMFEPEDDASKSFRPLSTSTPKAKDTGFAGLEKKVQIKEDVANKFLEALPSNMEKVVLKPSPFEGKFSEYYNELLLQVPSTGYSRHYDEMRITEIPSRYYIEVFQGSKKSDKMDTAFPKSSKYVKDKDRKLLNKPTFPTIQEDSFSSPSRDSFSTPTQDTYSTPTQKVTPISSNFNIQQKDSSFKTPKTTYKNNLLGNMTSMKGVKTPTRETHRASYDALQQHVMGRARLTPVKNAKFVGKPGGRQDKYIIVDDRGSRAECNTETSELRRRQYKLPSHIKKKGSLTTLKEENSPLKFKEPLVDFPGAFNMKPAVKKGKSPPRFQKSPMNFPDAFNMKTAVKKGKSPPRSQESPMDFPDAFNMKTVVKKGKSPPRFQKSPMNFPDSFNMKTAVKKGKSPPRSQESPMDFPDAFKMSSVTKKEKSTKNSKKASMNFPDPFTMTSGVKKGKFALSCDNPENNFPNPFDTPPTPKRKDNKKASKRPLVFPNIERS